MNKSELIDAIASGADISKAAAGRALDAFTSAVTSSLKGKDTVAISGFGSFVVRMRAAREGRNPRTGAKMQIPAGAVPAFRPGKQLKDAVKK